MPIAPREKAPDSCMPKTQRDMLKARLEPLARIYAEL